MKIPRKKTIIILCLLSVALIALSVLSQIYKYTLNDGHDRYLTMLFDLDGEQNIPTFFSTILLIGGSFLFFMIGALKDGAAGGYHRHWTTLGIIFFCMSADESLVLHEKTIVPLRNLFNARGLFYYAWIIPAGLFLLVLVLWYWKFLVDLPSRFRKLFIMSGAIYVMGTMGMEMLDGLFAYKRGKNNFIYAMLTNLEETIEIGGIILLIYALMAYIESLGGNLTLKIE